MADIETEVSPLDIKVKEEIVIDESNILGELARHSSKFLYWGSMWAKAARRKRIQRLKVNALQASLANDFRRQMSIDSPGTRVTDSMLKAYIDQHPDNIQALEELIKTEYMEEVLDVTRDAMKSRGMALQELAKRAREEEYYGDIYRNMEREYDEKLTEKKGKKLKRAEIIPLKEES